jgi:branched-chain amino acid transport system substrate-binding protein
MQFRREDHQALQPMYGFRLTFDPNLPWAVPVLTHEFTIAEMKVPITNKR